MTVYFTEQTGFFRDYSPDRLITQFGSPLYVYNEAILRERCRDMVHLIDYPGFRANFSLKTNSNMEILKIAREEGLHADAMSPGEIYILLKAGFKPEEILFVPNNVSEEEMRYAAEKGILISVDSISQLEMFGRLYPGRRVAVRFNPGKGAGHHEKVVTAGKKTKFGVNPEKLDDIKTVLARYDLTLTGVSQHIGSLFLECGHYLDAAAILLDIAAQFETIEYVDFGGGFGIPYYKQESQPRLDIKKLGSGLTGMINEWVRSYDAKWHRGSAGNITFATEPGRYVVAESCVLLGTVHAIKSNYDITYIGTDIGFNVLARPVLYDSYHDIELYRNGELVKPIKLKQVTIVGNICESGDILAKDRSLPPVEEGDIIGIMDAGAYGFSMSSNYNNRLRPAEVLLRMDGSVSLIRRRDSFEDLIRNF